jgi:hypothetical protein
MHDITGKVLQIAKKRAGKRKFGRVLPSENRNLISQSYIMDEIKMITQDIKYPFALKLPFRTISILTLIQPFLQ